MPLSHAQLKARLQWEASCERLRNSLSPPGSTPAASSAEGMAALKLAHEALDALGDAFNLKSRDDLHGIGGYDGDDGTTPRPEGLERL